MRRAPIVRQHYEDSCHRSVKVNPMSTTAFYRQAPAAIASASLLSLSLLACAAEDTSDDERAARTEQAYEAKTNPFDPASCPGRELTQDELDALVQAPGTAQASGGVTTSSRTLDSMRFFVRTRTCRSPAPAACDSWWESPVEVSAANRLNPTLQELDLGSDLDGRVVLMASSKTRDQRFVVASLGGASCVDAVCSRQQGVRKPISCSMFDPWARMVRAAWSPDGYCALSGRPIVNSQREVKESGVRFRGTMRLERGKTTLGMGRYVNPFNAPVVEVEFAAVAPLSTLD